MSAISSTALRACARSSLRSGASKSVVAAPSAALQQTRDASGASFSSPFKAPPTTKVPSFANYKSSSGENSNKVFSYFMAGSMGAMTAYGAKATVQGGCRHFPEGIGLGRRRYRLGILFLRWMG
jgi:ubiquinol-cytochrome c reductase iron-sulfur subunit